MNDGSSGRSLVRLSAHVVLPMVGAVTLVSMLSGGFADGALVRFANALLTAFTLVSFVLLLTLVVYGDARKRPIAPLLGMCLSVALRVGLTVFFLSQGELLMEDNGSVRAQALSNIVRFGTTMIALAMAAVIVFGTLFSSLMSGPKRAVHFEEE